MVSLERDLEGKLLSPDRTSHRTELERQRAHLTWTFYRTGSDPFEVTTTWNKPGERGPHLFKESTLFPRHRLRCYV